jgi:hypothetical protein
MPPNRPHIPSIDYSNMNQNLIMKIDQAHNEKVELERMLKSQQIKNQKYDDLKIKHE